VLVTGASGFIGAHVCDRLDAVSELHALSREPRPCSEQLRWRQADLADASAVAQVVRDIRPEVILHLGGRVEGTRERDAVLPMLEANLLGTVHVLLAAADHDVGRVVIAGSMEEPLPGQGDEKDAPQSPYAASKWAAAGYARMAHALYGVPAVILRIFMVYGPRQPDERKLVPYAIRSLLAGERPQLSSGMRPVDWIYVEDVVDAIMLAAEAPGAPGETVDVGSGELLTIRELVERLVSLVGTRMEPAFGALPDRPFERSRPADIVRAHEVLNWRPATPLDEGLRRTVDWYRHHPAPGNA
jgi:nucleoside-diphosphate-sugar epimerase